MKSWIAHSRLTNPGRHATQFTALGSDPETVVGTIQGLLIHGSALTQYGVADTTPFSRETLCVEARLASVLARHDAPFTTTRAPNERSLGTCRDYALLVCAAMRSHGQPARLRCGFAAYLGDAPWDDYWICELWAADRWRRLDAQLDPVLRVALGVEFDPLNVPAQMFMTATEAWRGCRAGAFDPSGFGHGDVRGIGFVCLNLMRDHLAMQDRFSDGLDGWRSAGPQLHFLSAEILTIADSLVADPQARTPSAFDPWW